MSEGPYTNFTLDLIEMNLYRNTILTRRHKIECGSSEGDAMDNPSGMIRGGKFYSANLLFVEYLTKWHKRLRPLVPIGRILSNRADKI
jgi:hypothetical protein